MWCHQEIVSYLYVIFNWDDFTVMDSGDGIIRNLQLAGDSSLWVWTDSFPDLFEQIHHPLLSRLIAAKYCFLFKFEFGPRVLGRGVADFGNNRYSFTCKNQIRTLNCIFKSINTRCAAWSYCTWSANIPVSGSRHLDPSLGEPTYVFTHCTRLWMLWQTT